MCTRRVSQALLPPGLTIPPSRVINHHSLPSSSIFINNPQTPPRIQQHAHKSRLPPRQQILRRTPPPLRRIPTPAPAPLPTVRIPLAELASLSAAAVWAAIARIVRARLARRRAVGREQARDGGDLLAAGLALRHLDVSLVEAELLAVDVGAEEEVADEEEEDAGDGAGDDGSDVGAGGGGVGVRAGAGAAVGVVGGSGFGCAGAGGGHGIGNRFAGCEGAGGRGCDGRGDGCAAVAVAADDFDDGFGDLVAVGALEAAEVRGVGELCAVLVEWVVCGGRVEAVVWRVVAGRSRACVTFAVRRSRAERCVLLHPFQVAQIEDIDARTLATQLVPDVSSNHDHLSVPNVASMSTATVWHRLSAHVDLDPCERWH